MHIVNGFVQKLFSEVLYTEMELKYPALKSYDYNFGGEMKDFKSLQCPFVRQLNLFL